MITSDSQTTLFAALSGIAFSGIGTAYKLGQGKGVSTAHVVLGLAGIAAVVTAMLAFPAQAHAPGAVWGLGVVAGVSQYFTIRLIGKGLALGSLSVVWCVVSLSFFPVIPFMCVYYGDRLGWAQYLGLGAALACVLLASFGHRQQPAEGAPPRPGQGSPPSSFLIVALVLTAILACNSISNFTQVYLSKTLPDGQTVSLLKQFDWLWMFVLYASASLTALVDLGLRRKLAAPPKWMLATGTLGAASSLAGISFQNLVSHRPMSFPINGAVGIIAAAVLSVVIFGERRTRAWYLTIGLGILAVVLGNLK